MDLNLWLNWLLNDLFEVLEFLLLVLKEDKVRLLRAILAKVVSLVQLASLVFALAPRIALVQLINLAAKVLLQDDLAECPFSYTQRSFSDPNVLCNWLGLGVASLPRGFDNSLLDQFALLLDDWYHHCWPPIRSHLALSSYYSFLDYLLPLSSTSSLVLLLEE